MGEAAARFRRRTGLALAVVLVVASGCAGPPSATVSPTVTATPGATVGAPSTPASTVLPTTSPTPTPTPAPSANSSGIPTRIVISTLKIDLPVIRLPASGIHYCGVALWWAYPGFVAPGQVGSVYLLAHSRAGMFLPLLDASLVNGGRSLLGLKIQLYTSADWAFGYAIVAVRRDVTSSGTSRLNAPLAATDAELWLQTSEGPSTASPYLQVVARLANGAPTSHGAAHPTPRPYLC
jgi:hypothetical protein